MAHERIRNLLARIGWLQVSIMIFSYIFICHRPRNETPRAVVRHGRLSGWRGLLRKWRRSGAGNWFRSEVAILVEPSLSLIRVICWYLFSDIKYPKDSQTIVGCFRAPACVGSKCLHCVTFINYYPSNLVQPLFWSSSWSSSSWLSSFFLYLFIGYVPWFSIFSPYIYLSIWSIYPSIHLSV